MKNTPKKVIQVNKKAYHNFNIYEKFVAGVVLMGTEIKSIRTGGLNFKDSYARIEGGEMWLHNCHISPYEQGNRFNHEAERPRKLLLNKREIMKIVGQIKQENYSVIPLEMFLSRGFAKVEIGLGKGKKLHDKRDTLKKKDIARSIARGE